MSKRLNRVQSKAVSELREITKIPRTSTAVSLLKKVNWEVAAATEAFFKKPSKYGVKMKVGSVSKLHTFFGRYCGDGSDTSYIIGDNFVRLCEDLKLDLKTWEPLVPSFVCGAKERYSFEKTEFTNGFRMKGIDTLEGLRKEVDSEIKRLSTDDKAFRKFYLWTFRNLKEEKEKNLGSIQALEAWSVLLVDRFPLLKEWLEFLQEDPSEQDTYDDEPRFPYCSADLWDLIWWFAAEIKGDLSNYELDGSGAWSVIFDDFVHWVMEKRKSS